MQSTNDQDFLENHGTQCDMSATNSCLPVPPPDAESPRPGDTLDDHSPAPEQTAAPASPASSPADPQPTVPPSAPHSRKPRPEAKLKRLPEPMQDSIYRFSVEHTLADTVDFIASVTGVETSNAAVSRFLAWYRVNLQLHRHDVIVRSLLDCKIDPDLTPEKTAELGHAFFSALALEQQDSRAWCQLQQIAIQRGRLSLQIQKFENHEKIIEQKNLPPPEGGISEETMALIERELNLF